MPRKLSRGKRLVTTAGIAAVAALALPGAAMAAECEVKPATPAFAAFADTNSYFLAPGGDFESLDAWTTRGRVKLVSGLNVLSLTGGSAVELSDNEHITSMSLCVDGTMPHLRFSGKASGSGQLDVTVRVTRDGSTDSSSGSVSSSDHKSWSPSRFIELKTTDIPAGESATATVQFRSQGSWLVDDVYVDPYRR